MTDFLRLHLIPRQALDMQKATLEDCVQHAATVADSIAESIAHFAGSSVELAPRPSDEGMRFVIDGNGIEVAYGCLLGDYFDNHMISEEIRKRNVGPSPAMKSYLLIRNPKMQRPRSVLTVARALEHDHLLNYEQGFPKGWQAFVRHHSSSEKIGDKEWRQRISTVDRGNAAMKIINLQPSEWVAKTDDGYVLRTKDTTYLN